MNRGEERTEEESEERRERGEERGERSGEEERGEERRREGGRREDDGELYLLLNSPCRGQQLLWNNREKCTAATCCPGREGNLHRTWRLELKSGKQKRLQDVVKDLEQEPVPEDFQT